MSDKAIYSVDTVETITDNDKIYVNTGDNIKQIKSSDLFIDINSNLDELAYGENHGGKNLWNLGDLSTVGEGFAIEMVDFVQPSGTYTLSCKSSVGFEFVFYDNSGNIFARTSSLEQVINATNGISKVSCWIVRGSVTNIQFEKGTTATPYEPYIPSVKMLAEEVNQQNESLEDYRLDNKANNLLQGGWNKNSSNKIEKDTERNKVSTEILQCIGGKTVSYKSSNAYDTYILFLDESQTFINYVNSNSAEFSTVSPSNAKYVAISFVSNSEITPQTVGKIGVYICNAIDELKNDLGVYVKGTTHIYVPASGRNTFEFPNQNIKNISVVTKTETVIPYVLFANEKYYLCCHNLLNSENTIEVDYSYYTT